MTTTIYHANDAIPEHFATRLLIWFEQYGRHDLPWQFHHKQTADIYAVWLSEIMLQQTQVATVLGYFERFLEQFPTVQALAEAQWQQIAPLWAGLGYYARVRNLHAGAKQVAQFIKEHGDFPQSVEQWQEVKGVGRSTAGAIVAMGVRGFGVICDGNVKRVLTRHRKIAGDINKSATDKKLWQLAEVLTPKQDSGKYAQAMMDLGATICTRTKPKCQLCPISADCLAYATDSQLDYPVKTKPKPKPHRHSIVLRLSFQSQVLWLHRQNGGGIWDGLWCLPLLHLSYQADEPLSDNFANYAIQAWHEQSGLDGGVLGEIVDMPDCSPSRIIRHTLTHFHWHLYRLDVQIDAEKFRQINQMLDAMGLQYQWLIGDKLAKPAAMVKLLHQAS